jgi:hypothetical protein
MAEELEGTALQCNSGPNPALNVPQELQKKRAATSMTRVTFRNQPHCLSFLLFVIPEGNPLLSLLSPCEDRPTTRTEAAAGGMLGLRSCAASLASAFASPLAPSSDLSHRRRL